MNFFLVAATIVQVALAGHVAVSLPYLNPAGVTYLGAGDHHGAPLVSAPGPSLEYAAHPSGYEGHSLHYAQAEHLEYAANPHSLEYAAHPHSLEYAAHPHSLEYAAHPHSLEYSAHEPTHHVEAHHVGYAAAQVPAVAAVPVVKHVPAIAEVPVTHVEAKHGYIEKQVDVAKPAVATRKFQVRRPAIQKHFYDIEERVIVRPAGSALVELDEPISKVQKGPAVVRSLEEHAHHTALEHQHAALEHQHAALAHGHEAVHVSSTPIYGHEAVHVSSTPIYDHESVHHHEIHVTPAPVLISSPSPAPVIISSTPVPHVDSDSIIVENSNFRSAAASLKQKERQLEDLHHQQAALQAEVHAARAAQAHSAHHDQEYGIVAHSNGTPLHEQVARLAAHDPVPAVVPSFKASPEESKANQHKLIQLLTARGGVAEVGFGREGHAPAPVGDAGHVHARVLSATPAPDYSEPTGERVSTRRVVVSRPIETVQEFDVIQPATKLERISVQQPTVVKTAHTKHVQVATSVPVYGKALAPAVAHAAVPVYQKTISPAPHHAYYH